MTVTKQQHVSDHAKYQEIPDGWQLVPVEPTIEMVQAATHSSVGFGTRAAYQAMLAAAPIRTKREKAIDAACKEIGGVGEDGLLIIERIYDAGMLK